MTAGDGRADDKRWMIAAYRLGYEHGRDGRVPSIPMVEPAREGAVVVDLMPRLMGLTRPRR